MATSPASAPRTAVSPPSPWQLPPPQSGLLKAGTILLLVGAILSAVGAFFLLFMTVFFALVFGELAADTDAPNVPVFILGFYGIWGLLALGGAACGIVAWRKAARNDLQGAFVWGLVGSLLPPLNIFLLLGAIFVKTCPEGEAQSRRPAPPQSP